MKVKQTIYITGMEQFLSGNYDNCFSILGDDRMADFDSRWFVVEEITINVKVDHEKMTLPPENSSDFWENSTGKRSF